MQPRQTCSSIFQNKIPRSLCYNAGHRCAALPQEPVGTAVSVKSQFRRPLNNPQYRGGPFDSFQPEHSAVPGLPPNNTLVRPGHCIGDTCLKITYTKGRFRSLGNTIKFIQGLDLNYGTHSRKNIKNNR